jgi:UDP-N-acetylmuramoyl-tripeptide--D-alanyl-D-alanine ligase
MEVSERADGVTVVNDAYNANPDSVRAALKALADMDVPGRRIAVLGGMLELGHASVEQHRATGRVAAELRIDLVLGVGNLAREVVTAFEAAGTGEAHWVGDNDAAHDLLESLLRPGDVVLLKSSRDAGLRWLGDRLAGVAPEGHPEPALRHNDPTVLDEGTHDAPGGSSQERNSSA